MGCDIVLIAAPYPFLFHFLMRGLSTCPNSAENIGGDKGSPCRMPDFIVTVLLALPYFISTLSPLYMSLINFAASGALRATIIFAKLSTASRSILSNAFATSIWTITTSVLPALASSMMTSSMCRSETVECPFRNPCCSGP